MLQDWLGEKAMEKNSNLVQLAQMPQQEDNQLIYLYDLQYYIEDINSKRIKKLKILKKIVSYQVSLRQNLKY